jgi:hypothetical protein
VLQHHGWLTEPRPRQEPCNSPPSAKKKALPGTWSTPTSTLEAASCISPPCAEAWSPDSLVPLPELWGTSVFALKGLPVTVCLTCSISSLSLLCFCNVFLSWLPLVCNKTYLRTSGLLVSLIYQWNWGGVPPCWSKKVWSSGVI